MSKPAPVPLLGRIAVQARLISMDQLAEVTAEQGRRSDGTPLGDILVEKGFITPRQLAALLRKQQEIAARQRAAAAGAAAPGQAAPRSAAAPPAPAAARAVPAPAPAPAPRADAAPLEALLRDAVARGASDVHVHAGAPPKLRIGGVLEEVAAAPLEPAATERLLLGALGEGDRAQLEKRGELDLCHAIPGLGRFRTNVFRQQRGLDAVFRFIPPQPPSLAELGLPTHLARHTNYHQGMVLVTGPTGCGKTSTLAALVDLINEERREHILTVEDPIEFMHPAKRCLVNQRSVERHTQSFARALRAALREDPDVIVIGELRDLETISLALTAAETGHLVLGTLHTRGAIRTVNRLVGAFPSDQQDQVRTMLSESLRAVVSQRLLRRADGRGRVAALETLVVNKAVENLIRENKTFQIHSILQTGSSQGMSLLDQSIRQLVQTGVVAREEALRHCEDPKSLGGS